MRSRVFNYFLCICLLGLILLNSFPALAQEEVPRVLLVGDSWTGFMWALRTFKGIFLETPGLENIREVGNRTAIMGARAYEFYPDEYNYNQNIVEDLQKYPTIDMVVMTIGGNDFLRGVPGFSRWKCDMLNNPADETALFNNIIGDVEGIVDLILSVRPDIRVALCSYTFTGRERDDWCDVCEQQNAFVRFEQAKKAIADSKDRVYYVHNFGLMQYHFGTVDLPPHQVPYPGGYPDYDPFPGGDPCQLVNPIALFDGDIHLSPDGYKIVAQRCMSEFLNLWLDYPKVYRINLVSSNSNSAVYQVTFSEPVMNVDVSDFQAKDSLSNPLSIVSVQNIDDKNYQVTVNMEGAADGQITFGVVDNDSITDTTGKLLGGPGTGNHEGNGDFWYNGVNWEYHDFVKQPDQEIIAGMWYLHENLSAYYVLLGEEAAGLSFSPEVCDINGGQIAIEPEVVISGNGMLDSLEFLLITECYNNPDIDFTASGGVSHQIALDTYDHNIQKMIADCGGETGIIYTVFYGLPQILAGFMTLGDANSKMIPLVLSIAAQAIDPSLNIRVNIINPTDYQILPQYFGPDGDADGDGWSNKKEYQYFVKEGMSFEDKKQAYINAALNPSVYPGSDCEQCQSSSSLGGIFKVGSDICLRVPEPVAVDSLFTWSKANDNLEERGLNTHCRSLWIPNAQIEDSGVYICEYDNGQEKAIVTHEFHVTVANQLPASSIGLFILLAGIIAFTSAYYIKKQHAS